jgi:hypothetical protein
LPISTPSASNTRRHISHPCGEHRRVEVGGCLDRERGDRVASLHPDDVLDEPVECVLERAWHATGVTRIRSAISARSSSTSLAICSWAVRT